MKKQIKIVSTTKNTVTGKRRKNIFSKCVFCVWLLNPNSTRGTRACAHVNNRMVERAIKECFNTGLKTAFYRERQLSVSFLFVDAGYLICSLRYTINRRVSLWASSSSWHVYRHRSRMLIIGVAAEEYGRLCPIVLHRIPVFKKSSSERGGALIRIKKETHLM